MSGVLGFRQAMELVDRFAFAAVASERPAETVRLLEARGRVLATAVVTDRDQPPFDRATRDGFAVRAADGLVRRRILGSVRAGELWGGRFLAVAEAIEIMTGAPVPSGADAVVMLEHVEREGDFVTPQGEPTAGGNVVRRGAELAAGAVALDAGVRVAPAEMAVAASIGAARLLVYARPRAAILATGDELVEVESIPAAQQIRNSNSYALAGLVEQHGGLPLPAATVRDTREALRAALLDASATADLLLISGGVSAGRYDLVEEVLAELGATFYFTGVRMQPGKPLVFGVLPRRAGGPLPFFGLPGNPVSTQVTFACFAAPLLRAIGGQRRYASQWARATLAEPMAARPGLTRLLPAQLLSSMDGTTVQPVAWQGSGDAAANARGDGYVLLPEGERDFAAGESVAVLLQ